MILPREPLGSAAAAQGAPIERGLTAVHAAAHAVAAVVLRLGLREVSIRCDAAELGLEPGHRTAAQRAARDPALLVATLAGPIAERRFGGAASWTETGGARDLVAGMTIARRIVRRWLAARRGAHEAREAPSDVEAQAALTCHAVRVAHVEAARLVEATRPAIAAVVREMLLGAAARAGVLPGTAVRRLVREHGGAPADCTAGDVRAAIDRALRGAAARSIV